MVRTGMIEHPQQWADCGYQEIQQEPKRYRIIDQSALVSLCGLQSNTELQQIHRNWIEEALNHDTAKLRDTRWTEGVAVGQRDYIKSVHTELGYRTRGRECIELENGYQLKELPGLYEVNSG